MAKPREIRGIGTTVGEDRFGRLVGCVEKPAEDETRPDQDHLDPEGRQLAAQPVGDRLNRMLGGVVDRRQRPRNASRHRADVDDPARPALPEMRRHELREGDERKHVGLEIAADELQRHQLHRTARTIAGVVHQRVDAPELPERAVHDPPPAGVVRHVGGDREHALPRRIELARQRLKPVRPPCGNDQFCTAARQPPRRRLADAR